MHTPACKATGNTHGYPSSRLEGVHPSLALVGLGPACCPWFGVGLFCVGVPVSVGLGSIDEIGACHVLSMHSAVELFSPTPALSKPSPVAPFGLLKWLLSHTSFCASCVLQMLFWPASRMKEDCLAAAVIRAKSRGFCYCYRDKVVVASIQGLSLLEFKNPRSPVSMYSS